MAPPSKVRLEALWAHIGYEFEALTKVADAIDLIQAAFQSICIILDANSRVCPESVILFVGDLLCMSYDTLHRAGGVFPEKYPTLEECWDVEAFKRFASIAILHMFKQSEIRQLFSPLFCALTARSAERVLLPQAFPRLLEICDVAATMDRCLKTNAADQLLLDVALLIALGGAQPEDMTLWDACTCAQTSSDLFNKMRNVATQAMSTDHPLLVLPPSTQLRLVQMISSRERPQLNLYRFFLFTLLVQAATALRAEDNRSPEESSHSQAATRLELLYLFLDNMAFTFSSIQRATLTRYILYLLTAGRLTAAAFVSGFAIMEPLLWPRRHQDAPAASAASLPADETVLAAFLACKGYRVLSQLAHVPRCPMSRVTLSFRLLLAILRQGAELPDPSADIAGNAATLIRHFEWYLLASTSSLHLRASLLGDKRALAFQLLANWPSALSDLPDRVCFSLTFDDAEYPAGPGATVGNPKQHRVHFFRSQSLSKIEIVFDLFSYCLLHGREKNFFTGYIQLLSDSSEIFTRSDLDTQQFPTRRLVARIGTLLVETTRVDVAQACMTWLDRAVTTYWRGRCGSNNNNNNNKVQQGGWHAQLSDIFESFLDRLGVNCKFFAPLPQSEKAWDLGPLLRFSTLHDTECRLKDASWQSIVTRISLSQGALFPKLILLPLYVLRAKTDSVINATKQADENNPGTTAERPWETTKSALTALLNDIRLPMFYILKCFGAASSCARAVKLPDSLRLFTVTHLLLSFEVVNCLMKGRAKKLFWELRELSLGFVGTFLVAICPFVTDMASVTLFLTLSGCDVLVCVLHLLHYAGPQSGKGRPEILETILVDELADLPTRVIQLVQRCFELCCLAEDRILPLLKPECMHAMLRRASSLTRLQLLQTLSVPLFGASKHSLIVSFTPWDCVVEGLVDPLVKDAGLKEETLFLILDLLTHEKRMFYHSPGDAARPLANALRHCMQPLLPCCDCPTKQRRDDDASEPLQSVCLTCGSVRSKEIGLFWVNNPAALSLVQRIAPHLNSDDQFVIEWLLSSRANDCRTNSFFSVATPSTGIDDHESFVLQWLGTPEGINDPPWQYGGDISPAVALLEKDFDHSAHGPPDTPAVMQRLPKQCLEIIRSFLINKD